MNNFRVFIYISIYSTVVKANCNPDPDEPVQLGSPANVTAPLGSDIQFICCSGLKWTYEADQGQTSREIGPHPDAAGAPEKSSSQTTETERTTQTTVYTMRDDKGRLILLINQANVLDSGHYRCHGYNGYQDAHLIVTPQKYVEGQINPASISTGSVIRSHLMFSSDQLEHVILQCPVTESQVIYSWLWREPILPNSDEFSKLPEGHPPSRTVTAIRPGRHEGGHVEIGPNLAWARILDPLSPEAPVKVWCQFEMPSPWKNKEPVVAYYVMDWELYDPIAPKIYLLKSTQPDAHTAVSAEVNAATLIHELDQAGVNQQSALVYEHKPARFACRFRVVGTKMAEREMTTQPAQHVYWYRNAQPVHVPPFHVDNTLVAIQGISLLTVRSYPSWFQTNRQYSDEREPKERITCVVNSLIKTDPIYKVTTNASMDVDVILMPRIINESLLSAESKEDDSVQLSCVAIANGPPHMLFEVSPVGSGRPKNEVTDWIPVESRHTLSIKRVQPDRENPLVHRLVLDISNVRRTDHGLYRCSVWNGAGRVHSVGQLLVRSPPEVEIFSPGSNYYVDHRPWITACHVTGYPLALRKPAIMEVVDQTSSAPALESLTAIQNGNYAVHVKVLNVDGSPTEKAEVMLLKYDANQFLGINATFELRISQREGQESVVRCEYTHTDGQVITREIYVRHATKPPAPEISVVCSGPRAVVFSVSNPVVKPDSPPTDRIVTQKVMFAPAKTFHDSATLASLMVYLDQHGQPSAYPSNQTFVNGLNGSHVTVRQKTAELTNTAIIPVTGLIDDTEYVFEWASGNEFGLSVMVQFMLWTTRQDIAPAIQNVIYLRPREGHLRFSVFLADPCPYEGGARLELSDVLVRFRPAKPNSTMGNTIATADGRDNLFGYGEWSEMTVCENAVEDKPTSSDFGSDSPENSVQWSGDTPIFCEISVENTADNYEVQFATRNRFNRSEWFTGLYRLVQATHAAFHCAPPCAAVTFQQTIIFINVCSLLTTYYRLEM